MILLPILGTFRGAVLASSILLLLGIYQVVMNSKDKKDYSKTSGAIEYLGKTYQNLPYRNQGDFRYLKIDAYPYVFEIYEPNHEPTSKAIDDLRIGDTIDIYYNETSDTRNIGLNRFAQFIDSNGQPYFVANGFQRQLGYAIIGLCILVSLLAFVFWKRGKLNW